MVQHATKIGVIGLLIWSAGALFNSFACMLPTFEILTIALGIAFLVGALHLSVTKTWHKLKPISIYVFFGFLGVFGNELCYVSAFKFAPAAHITLINYLWPIMVIALSNCLSNDKLSLRIIIAAVLGFCSVAYITLSDSNAQFDIECWLGYLLVILGTIMWSLYILANRSKSSIPSEMITPYCGIGAIISLVIHYQTETFIIPDLQQTLALLWLGIMGMYVAFRCWNFGISLGKVSILSVLSYNNVLISTLLLIIFNQTAFNPQLIFSVLGLMLASVLSIFELALIKDTIKALYKKKSFLFSTSLRPQAEESTKSKPL